MHPHVHHEGARATVSLFAAVAEAALDPAPVRRLAGGAAALALADLGPALAAAGLAYGSPAARHAAATLLAALREGFGGPIAMPGPDDAAEALGAEACGVAPLPALVIAGDAGRQVSRAALLAIPPELWPAARIALLGHARLPARLLLAESDRAAINAAIPRATSLAHAAALAGRTAVLRAMPPETREAAGRFAFGEASPPDFLPEHLAEALAPGAEPQQVMAMAQAVAPFLAEPPFCPAGPVPFAATRRPAARAPAPLMPLFPEAPAASPTAARLRRIS